MLNLFLFLLVKDKLRQCQTRQYHYSSNWKLFNNKNERRVSSVQNKTGCQYQCNSIINKIKVSESLIKLNNSHSWIFDY